MKDWSIFFTFFDLWQRSRKRNLVVKEWTNSIIFGLLNIKETYATRSLQIEDRIRGGVLLSEKEPKNKERRKMKKSFHLFSAQFPKKTVAANREFHFIKRLSLKYDLRRGRSDIMEVVSNTIRFVKCSAPFGLIQWQFLVIFSENYLQALQKEQYRVSKIKSCKRKGLYLGNEAFLTPSW